jgi:hypothetical protein
VAVIAAANRITRPYPDGRNCRSSLAQITPRLLQDDCAAEVLTATESDRVALRQQGPYPPRSRHGRAEGEIHPEGSYFLEFLDQGKRKRKAVGSDAFVVADRVTRRQAELSAIHSGLIEAPVIVANVITHQTGKCA